jgi:perosamine synthetase
MNKARRYWHEEVGFNYRMTSLQAAVGLAQLERLDVILERRRQITQRYLSGLADTGLGLPKELPGTRNVFWMFNVLAPTDGPTRDELSSSLDLQGIDSRNVFYPLHQMPPYRRFVASNASFPVSEEFSRRGLSLPSSSRLSDSTVDRVIHALRVALGISSWTPTPYASTTIA